MWTRAMAEREFGPLKRPLVHSPAQTMTIAFAVGVFIGTGLLLLPASRTGQGSADFFPALFTSTSALCTSGLSTVDPARYWTPFGRSVILVLIQVGGFGIMTLASLLGILVARKLGLRSRINAATESNTLELGDVREVMIGAMEVTALTEVAIALVLAVRFATAYQQSPAQAAYLGVAHSISAFNNAGFAWYPGGLVPFVADPWICMPINIGIIVGGIGFPVLFELRKVTITPRLWSLNTKLTVWGTVILLVGGTMFLTAAEWNNPATMGPLDAPARLLAGFTQAVQPRSAGFNSLDYGQMHESSIFVTTVLMFIGGGSASTAGGIKVGTFFLLFFVMWAEVRGFRDVEIAGRRMGHRTIRQALTVGLLSIGLVLASTLIFMLVEPFRLNLAMFEVVSAFGNAGLSTGITPALGVPAQLILVVLMFVGRIGPVTMVSALALRERQHFYRYPEGRPLIG